MACDASSAWDGQLFSRRIAKQKPSCVVRLRSNFNPPDNVGQPILHLFAPRKNFKRPRMRI